MLEAFRERTCVHCLERGSLGGQAADDLEEVVGDCVHGLVGVDLGDDAALLVVVEQRLGERVVLLQAGLKRGGVVVVAVHEGLARDVILARNAGRVVADVVGAARCHVDHAASHAVEQELGKRNETRKSS